MTKHTFFLVVDEEEIVIHDELFNERHACEAHIDMHGLDACHAKEVYLDLSVVITS